MVMAAARRPNPLRLVWRRQEPKLNIGTLPSLNKNEGKLRYNSLFDFAEEQYFGSGHASTEWMRLARAYRATGDESTVPGQVRRTGEDGIPLAQPLNKLQLGWARWKRRANLCRN